jgi:trehalose-6-phosphate synthase
VPVLVPDAELYDRFKEYTTGRNKMLQSSLQTTTSLYRFYNGCCNATFWPLFHSMPDRTVFDIQTWQVKNMKTNI